MLHPCTCNDILQFHGLIRFINEVHFWGLIGQLGLTEPSYYYYLNQSGTYSVEGTNDVKEYEETRVSTC